jgi:hypothetical protein
MTPPPAGRRLAALAAAVLLAAYAVLLVRDVGAVAGGSDSSGYMNHARLLASGRLHAQPRTLPGLSPSDAHPFVYVPLGFKAAWNGDGLVPTYPAGFSLLVMLAKPLAGWRHAGDLAIIAHSLAGLVATYLLGGVLGLGRRWAFLGAGVVGLSPLYLFMSLQAMSDVPSLAWTTLAVVAALKSREKAPWAIAAGAAIAVDVLLRPTNILAFVPAAIALGLSPRRWLLFAAGGLPGAAFLATHNLALYGRVLTTGYGDNSVAFRASYVRGTLLHYAHWLPALLTPLAALDLGLPFFPRIPARTRWLLCSWIAAYACFYSAYFCTHETWWYLRFLLPAAPAMVVGGLLVARAALSRLPPLPGRTAAAAFGAALALVAVNAVVQGRELHPLIIGHEELRYGRVCDWLQKNIPGDSVCVAMQASGALFYYTDFTFVRWDSLAADNIAAFESAVRASRRPEYAVLFPFEVQQSGILEGGIPGNWAQVGKVSDITIWRRGPDAAKP